MCVAKPKIVRPDQKEPKDPAIIRNSYLDGVDPQTRSMRTGRSSLRIQKGGGGARSGSAPAIPTAPPSPAHIAPRIPPVRGGGVSGGYIPRNIARINMLPG